MLPTPSYPLIIASRPSFSLTLLLLVVRVMLFFPAKPVIGFKNIEVFPLLLMEKKPKHPETLS